MADIFMIKQWLKFSLKLMGILFVLSALASWHFWGQQEYIVDHSSFKFSVVLTSGLAVGWFGVLLVYIHAVCLGDARGRSLTDWVDSVPWGKVGGGLGLLLFCAGVWGLYYFSDREVSIFDLLREGQFSVLNEQILENSELLSRREGKGGATLVQVAFRENHPEAFVQLIALGAHPEGLDPAGRSPVVASIENLPMLEALLEAGFKPDLRDEMGRVPLQYAVAMSAVEALVMLADAGADVNVRDASSRTPLMLVGADLTVMKALLERGGDPRAFDQRGNSPLHMAVKARSLELLHLLLDYGADPRAFNLAHQSPFHLAVQTAQFEMIEVLMEDPNMISLRDDLGQTPLECALLVRKYDVAEWLMDRGANIDRVRADRSTLLHEAVLGDNYRTARFLIQFGADVLIRNGLGETAHDIMRRKEQAGLLALLSERADFSDAPTEDEGDEAEQ